MISCYTIYNFARQHSSTTLWTTSCPAGDVFAFNIPEDGILFKGGMKCSAIGADTSATVLLDK